LNELRYGNAVVKTKAKRVEFELGIPTISLPGNDYYNFCTEIIKQSSTWAAADGDKGCVNSIREKCPTSMKDIVFFVGRKV
jgi:hypothetical protein